jgi:hypothetical protein
VPWEDEDPEFGVKGQQRGQTMAIVGIVLIRSIIACSIKANGMEIDRFSWPAPVRSKSKTI